MKFFPSFIEAADTVFPFLLSQYPPPDAERIAKEREGIRCNGCNDGVWGAERAKVRK